jgi:rubrerythrin
LFKKEGKMAEFVDPFRGKVPDRTLTLSELIRAIRLDVAAEQEATHIYTAQAEATDNPIAKRVLLDIAREERVHSGEFLRLLSILTEGEEDAVHEEGAREVDEMAAAEGMPQEATMENPITVGSLKE